MGQGLVQNYQHQTNVKWTVTKYRKMVKSHSLWMSFGHETSFQSEEFHKLNSLLAEGSTPMEGSCLYWGGSHYRLFDGTVLSLPKGCSHTLLTEPRDNTMKISTKTATDCTPGNCPLKIHLTVETEEYEVSLEQGCHDKRLRNILTTFLLGNNRPIATNNGQSIVIPGQHNGVTFEQAGDWLFIEVQGLGFKLHWNLKVLKFIETYPKIVLHLHLSGISCDLS